MGVMKSIVTILVLLSIVIGGDAATNPQSSDTNRAESSGKDNESVYKIRQTFAYLNDKNFLTATNLADLREKLTKAIDTYDSMPDKNSGSEVVTIVSRMRILRNLLDGYIEHRCTESDLFFRAPEIVGVFSQYANLYLVILGINLKHVAYCFKILVSELHETIENELKPKPELLGNMESFRQYLEASHRRGEATSEGLRIFGRDQYLDAIVKRSLVDYFESEYSFQLARREMVTQNKIRFIQLFERFMEQEPAAFCAPILNVLMRQHKKLFALFKIDPGLESKMDSSTYKWASMMQVCKRLNLIGPSLLYKSFIAKTFDITDIETKLLDPTRELEPEDTQQLLEILRQLYYDVEIETITSAIQISSLLAAANLSEEKCNVSDYESLLNLREANEHNQNLSGYLSRQIERQLSVCLPKFERDLKNAIGQIDFVKRNKVTEFRHKVERQINPSCEQNKLWRLDSASQVEIFSRGLLDYVNDRTKYKSSRELKAAINAKLKPSCKQVQEKLLEMHKPFEVLARLNANFARFTDSWMSSFVLCNYYMQNSFNWDQIFIDLRAQSSSKASSSSSSYGGLMGCKRLD